MKIENMTRKDRKEALETQQDAVDIITEKLKTAPNRLVKNSLRRKLKARQAFILKLEACTTS